MTIPRHTRLMFVVMFLGYNQYQAGWVYVFIRPGAHKDSTGSGSGFKVSQKTGPRLKVSSNRLGEAGNQTRLEFHSNSKVIILVFQGIIMRILFLCSCLADTT